MAAPGQQSIANLLYSIGKELTCPICLSLAKPPTARLECCHYFCRQCITTSLKRQSHCPICKEPANRRNVAQDARFDSLVTLYAQLEAVISPGQQIICTQVVPPASTEDTSAELRAAWAPIGLARELDGPSRKGSDVVVPDSQPAPKAPAASPAVLDRPAKPASEEERCGPPARERGAAADNAADRRQCLQSSGTSNASVDAMMADGKGDLPEPCAGTATGYVASAASKQLGRAARALPARRVPSRLQPWACRLCTLENKSSAARCEACRAPKTSGSEGVHGPVTANPTPHHGSQQPSNTGTACANRRQPAVCEGKQYQRSAAAENSHKRRKASGQLLQ